MMKPVVPAKAGIQVFQCLVNASRTWVPAKAAGQAGDDGRVAILAAQPGCGDPP